MRSLWRPVPQPNRFIRLENWFGRFKEFRQSFDGGSGPLPHKILETAEGLVADFFAENEPPVVLHGDFHHYNLLKAGEVWKAIDPKGVIGPRGYEAGPFLINPWGDPSTGSGQALLHGPDAKRISERRIAILSEQLGMERSRIRGWGIAHAVLSACWSLKEQGSGGEHAIHCAELFAQISA
jgi:streptomycin 6-kinase